MSFQMQPVLQAKQTRNFSVGIECVYWAVAIII